MANRAPILLKIFRIELEEAENSILGTLEYYANRFKSHEITSYVWMENRALLKKEITCVKELALDVVNWSPPDKDAVDEIIDDLQTHLKELVKERGYPALVNLVIDKISMKTKRYLE